MGIALDSVNPLTWAGAAKEAVLGDKYHFLCECGHEWSTDDESEDQTAEYQRECELRQLTNSQNVRQHCQHLNNDFQNYVNNLHSIVDSANDEGIKERAYEALSFCYYSSQDKTKARDMIDKALSIEKEPDTRVLRGIYNDTPCNAQGLYERLRDLVCVNALKNEDTDLYFTPIEIKNLIGETTEKFSEAFLSMPIEKRKYLYVVSTYDELRLGALDNKEIKLLPMESVPTKLQTLDGPIQPNVLYKLHPYASDIYIPLDDYEKQVLQDEVNELRLFLMTLGAKTIKIVDTSSNGNESSSKQEVHGKANAKYNGVGGEITGGMDSSDENTTLICDILKTQDVFDQQDQWGIRKSTWYESIKEWRDLAESRKGGARELNLTISTKQFKRSSHSEMQQLGVDFEAIVGSAHAEAERSILHKQEEEKEHTWKLQIEFYPLKSYNKEHDDVQVTNTQPLPQKDKNKILPWVLIGIIVVLLGIIASIIL